MRRNHSTRPRTARLCGLGLVAVASFGLSGCAEGPSPVGTTQWQVTSLYQDPDTPADLPGRQEGRLFIVIGENSLTCASGCYNLTANVKWDEPAEELTVEKMNIEQMSSGRRDCHSADERNAHRLKDIINDQTLHYSRPNDRSLKLTRVVPDAQEWQTLPSVTMISRPN